MKKLAIVVLLVVAGCRRQVVVTSAPGTSGPGAATPREAVQLFMASAKAQDLQAMSNIWGSAAGPARTTMEQSQMEQRQIIMMRCLRHDTYSILAEVPVAGTSRVFTVEVRLGTLTPRADFTATRGPQERWFLQEFQMAALNSICVAR